jgi:hypothetical protein
MSDSFQVAAESNEILAASHLVEEMKHCSEQMEMFPVLIDDFVGYFHDVQGGYHRSENYHVVNLIHEVQGPDSPPNKTHAEWVEVHMNDCYFYLEVEAVWEFGDYPDEDYTLSLKVTGYRDGSYAFSEELQTEVDKRETEHEWEG